MTDHFQAKAADWDTKPHRTRMADAVAGGILARVPLTPAMEVLDFGAGTGLLSERLMAHVARITAVDTSAAMLEQLAAKEALKGRVEPVCLDLLARPLERTFDLIVSSMTAHHVEDTALLLQRFHEHLKAGGRLALADLDAEDGRFHEPGTQGVHHHGFHRSDLQAALESTGFQEVAFETVHHLERDGRIYPVFLMTALRG